MRITITLTAEQAEQFRRFYARSSITDVPPAIQARSLFMSALNELEPAKQKKGMTPETQNRK